MRMQLREALLDMAEAALGPALEDAVHAVARKEQDPYTAAETLVAAFRGKSL
jgi:LAO/AO transport system kinase